MPPPSRIKQPTELADLEWLITDDGSRTLWNSQLDETYHSGCGAVAECLVVYLSNSGVLRRLCDGQATKIFELGFGTGTAFLLTAALAEKLGTRLDYWAIDIRPLPAQFVRQLNLQPHVAKAIHDNFIPDRGELTARSIVSAEDFSLLATITAELAETLAQLDIHNCTPQQTRSVSIGQFCRLHLVTGDATAMDIDRDYPQSNSQMDAIYFDAFSPETNPELWTESVMRQMYKLLRTDGHLTSYCVKSAIRKVLHAAGFFVTRLPGPIGGKREVLRASRNPMNADSVTRTLGPESINP
jgi:tRNA U34 5-methylaminomethyl-2-thiouridine-forming methyltransferase MnmC